MEKTVKHSAGNSPKESRIGRAVEPMADGPYRGFFAGEADEERARQIALLGSVVRSHPGAGLPEQLKTRIKQSERLARVLGRLAALEEKYVAADSTAPSAERLINRLVAAGQLAFELRRFMNTDGIDRSRLGKTVGLLNSLPVYIPGRMDGPLAGMFDASRQELSGLLSAHNLEDHDSLEASVKMRLWRLCANSADELGRLLKGHRVHPGGLESTMGLFSAYMEAKEGGSLALWSAMNERNGGAKKEASELISEGMLRPWSLKDTTALLSRLEAY